MSLGVRGLSAFYLRRCELGNGPDAVDLLRCRQVTAQRKTLEVLVAYAADLGCTPQRDPAKGGNGPGASRPSLHTAIQPAATSILMRCFASAREIHPRSFALLLSQQRSPPMEKRTLLPSFASMMFAVVMKAIYERPQLLSTGLFMKLS